MARSGNSGDGSGENAGGRGFRWTDLFGNSSSETGWLFRNEHKSTSTPLPWACCSWGWSRWALHPWGWEWQSLDACSRAYGRIGPSPRPWKKNWSRASIIAAQITVEERVEDALLQDGFSPDAILDKRHRIRGFLFYPGGTSLTEPTYVGYVRSIDNLGTRASAPYKR